jgi:hypothetical protein
VNVHPFDDLVLGLALFAGAMHVHCISVPFNDVLVNVSGGIRQATDMWQVVLEKHIKSIGQSEPSALRSAS